MKTFFRYIIKSILKFFAKIKLSQVKPCIIGVTGSVGKTSAKDAIYTVLKNKFSVKRSEKNFNTEFGVPLTILGQKSGFSSPKEWIKILIKSFFAIFKKENYKFLILEMGVDKPGDMDELLSIIHPNTAIITKINLIHSNPGQFYDRHAVFNEKKKLALKLENNGTAILNYDDEILREFGKNELHGKVLWFGTTPVSDLYINYLEQKKAGLGGEMVFHGKRARFLFPILGKHHIYILLPAVMCGLINGLTLEECISELEEFSLPPGRMNLLPGINDSEIIDSSYNASPVSMAEALKVLGEFGGKDHRKIAVLGDMNELGSFSEREHRKIGQIVGKYADVLITVGEFAQLIAEEAGLHGISTENVITFSDAKKTGEFLKTYIKPRDVILVKGSQNKIRLENAIKEIMQNPEMAERVLVRQGPEWQKK